MIEKLYADLLPPGQHVVATIHHRKKKGLQHYVVEHDELMPFLQEQDTSTYHSLGAYKGLENGPIHRVQNLTGCTGVKAWGVDLDVGNKDTEYASVEEAAQSLAALVEAGDIPEPTWVISSGGGLQFYLVLGDTIDEELWTSHFLRFRSYLKGKMKFDPTVGSKPYKLFRSPCTENYKYHPVRPVEIIHEGEHVDLSWFEDLPQIEALKHSDTSTTFKVDNPVPIRDVLTHCRAMRETYKERGKTTGYNRWCATASICAHTYQGRKNFQILSQNHPEYTETDTDEKYEEIKHNASNGPWGCDHFGDPENPKSACHKCPHKHHAKNPIHAVRIAKGEVTRPVKKNSEEDVELADIEEIETDSTDRLDGVVHEQETNEQVLANLSSKPLLDKFVIDGDTWVNGKGTTICNFFHFKKHQYNPETEKGSVKVSPDGVQWVALTTDQLASPAQAAAICIGIGMPILEANEFVKLVKHYTLGQERTLETDHYGWVADYSGALTPGGFVGEEPIAEGPDLSHLHSKWAGNAGTWEGWLDAIQIYDRAGQEPYLVALLTSLASPLMSYFRLERGVIYSLLGPGGAGKTSAMRVATSVWGKPLETLGSLSSTFTAIRLYLKLCGNLPMVIDDLTQLPTEELKQLALEISQGLGRERSTKDLKLRESETWYLTFLTTTNTSLHARLAELVDVGTAEMDRVVEVPVSVSRQVSTQQGQEMLDNLQENYGHAGAKLLEHMLTKDRDTMIKEQRNLSKQLQEKDGLEGKDRFARDLIIGCYYAHRTMKEIDERFPGDPTQTLIWMRKMLRENNRYIQNTLNIRLPKAEDFILDYAADNLIIERSSTGTYSPQGVSMKGYIFDSGEDWYCVPKETLETWCRRNNLKLRTLLESWAKSGRLFNFATIAGKSIWMGKDDHPIICDGRSLQPTLIKIHKSQVYNAGSENVTQIGLSPANNRKRVPRRGKRKGAQGGEETGG